jgi:cysteine desulfurase/selenocysteine lyase
MDRYYQRSHANVHRSVFVTAAEATAAYEGARERVATFLNAPGGADGVVFTKNTTESFNLLARSWGASTMREGDVVVLSEMEHHANIVPWFQLRETHGIEVRFLGVTDEYRLDLSNFDELIDGAKLLSITGMSNVLGTINPIRELTARAHDAGALVAIDGAQSVAHLPTDLAAIGADFMAFSGHKLMGPTGIGVLWARPELLNVMPPFLGGGGMIADVSVEGFTAASGPAKFEAGTPPIAEAVGLDAALRYLSGLGMDNVAAHEAVLTADALSRLEAQFSGRVRIIGPSNATDRGGVISLDVDGVHPHDVAQVLDQYGVCVRPGHHCAKPLMKRFGLAATARVSFGPYSNTHDTDVLLDALSHAIAMFG